MRQTIFCSFIVGILTFTFTYSYFSPTLIRIDELVEQVRNHPVEIENKEKELYHWVSQALKCERDVAYYSKLSLDRYDRAISAWWKEFDE